MTMGHGTSWLGEAHFLCVVALVYVCVCGTNASYVWRKGLWGECRHYSCGRGGTQSRAVWCSLRESSGYQSVDEVHCSHLPKPKEVRECFKVCEVHYNQLRWATYVWTPCALDPEYSECARDRGVQHRNVTCVWRETGLEEDDSVCAEFEIKPASSQACELKCPQNCVVTPFTSWSMCNSCLLQNRTRTRSMLIPPANDGDPCPKFSEMIPCSNCSDHYTFKIWPWEDCSPYDEFGSHHNLHPLIGFQKRNIRCLNSYGSVVGYKACIHPLRSMVEELTDRQTCIIPQDCIVSEWSPWKPLNTSCMEDDGTKRPGFMVRTRSVLQIPLGSGSPCPNLQHTFEVQGSVDKPCSRAKWITSSWGYCVVPPGALQCTTGLQTCDAICVEEEDPGHFKPVDLKKCRAPRPITSRVCRAECDLDCTVSQWAEWTECKVTDCELYARRKRTDVGTGQRYRTREILTPAGGEGTPCPHLSETQMCDPQPCYHWNMTVGQCRLLNGNIHPPCGLGIAYRTIACVNKLNQRVSDSLCEELAERPKPKEDCSIPCPNDCITTHWSEWQPCPDLCQEGRARPAIRTRHRRVLALQGLGGAPCPPNRNLEEAQQCPTTIECAVYVWQTEPWGRCELRNARCGTGFRLRDVNCYSLHGHLVSEQRCTLKVKPNTTEECQVPCPLDCQLTEFSNWNACSATCWEAKQTVPVKTRVRHVIQKPQYGGIACPDKLTEVKQCTELPLCRSFYWHTSPWSPCYLPLDKIPQCGQGLMARNVTCKADNGTIMPVDVCIRHNGPIPDISQVCYKPCQEECVFEEWSAWSLCVSGCKGNRFRTRKLIETPASPSTLICKDRRLYPIDMFEQCKCEGHVPVPVGNWSECILEPSSGRFYKTTAFQGGVTQAQGGNQLEVTRVGVNAVCGTGIRYKVLACQNEQGEMEAANRCTQELYKQEVCLIECPVDCVMSEWSQWSDCSNACGAGTQMRYRHIKQSPTHGGRLCPSLDNSGKETQTRVCNTDCLRFIWREYPWGICMPDAHDRPCGHGSQTRTIRCEAMTSAGFSNNEVDEHQCLLSRIKPRERQECNSPCTGECVVSEWSEWSKCGQPCSDPNQVQTRTRTILRNPESFVAMACPSLLEERFCRRGDNCFEFSWHLSEWTSCLVNNGLDECGEGHKERHAVCKNHLNQVVSNTLCEEALGAVVGKLLTSCKIACDVDCLLTEWSTWDDCSHTCSLGVRTRSRAIVQEPWGNGRLCPDSLRQTKPCFEQGCYTWVVSPWSLCTQQVGICGHGVQKRNITCVGSGGMPVNTTKCRPDLNVIVTQTERPCLVPCPGECVLTDWTAWNQCFLDCKDYRKAIYTRGVQSRSRAVLAIAQGNNPQCPEQLWESRPCEARTCYSFSWRTSEWSFEKTRNVWCERSDGMLVQGGCAKRQRPANILNCYPPCRVKNSFCNNTNLCACKENYESAYTDGILSECRMENSTVSTEVAETTLPEDGPSNVWMYAVIAAGTIFVIFLAAGCYSMSEFFHKGPRPRKKGEDESIKGDTSTLDGKSVLAGQDVVETKFVCSNHIPAVATPAALAQSETGSLVSADRTPPPTIVRGNASVSTVPRHVPLVLHDSDLPVCASLSDVVDVVSSRSDVVVVDGGEPLSTLPCMSPSSAVSALPTKEEPSDLYASVDKTGSVRSFLASKSPKKILKTKMLWLSNKLKLKDKSQSFDVCDTGTSNSRSMPMSQSADAMETGINMRGYSSRTYIAVEDVGDYHQVGGERNGTVHGEGTVPVSSSPGFGKLSDTYLPFRERNGTEKRVESQSVRPVENRRNAVRKGDKDIKSGTTHHETVPLLSDNNDSGFVTYRPQQGTQDVIDTLYSPSTAPDDSDFLPCPSCGQRRQDSAVASCADSLDSIGNTRSVSSRTSSKSRAERQKLLTVTNGPVIKIAPQEERVFVGNPSETETPTIEDSNYSGPLKPKRIGYIAFSSLDTETSSAVPSTSGSMESLPSGDDLTSDQSMTEGLKSHNDSTDGGKSAKNIALDSIKRGNCQRKSLKDVPKDMKDSGLGMSMKTTHLKHHKRNAANGNGARAGVASDSSVRSNKGQTASPGDVTATAPVVSVHVQQKPRNTGKRSDRNIKLNGGQVYPESNMGDTNRDTTNGMGATRSNNGRNDDGKHLSPFNSLDVSEKRKTMKQAGSCGHLELSDGAVELADL